MARWASPPDRLPHGQASVMNERSMESVPDFRTPRSSVAPDDRPLTFDGAPTTIDPDAVERLRRTLIPEGTKGMPWRASDMTLAELGATGWATLDGAFPMPLMILRESALATNIAAMADYCLEHGVWLSPHGKTTMSPQLFQRQIDAGAWGLTAATPAPVQAIRNPADPVRQPAGRALGDRLARP